MILNRNTDKIQIVRRGSCDVVSFLYFHTICIFFTKRNSHHFKFYEILKVVINKILYTKVTGPSSIMSNNYIRKKARSFVPISVVVVWTGAFVTTGVFVVGISVANWTKQSAHVKALFSWNDNIDKCNKANGIINKQQ